MPMPHGYKLLVVLLVAVVLIEHCSRRTLCAPPRKRSRLVVHCRCDAPNSSCRNNRQWAANHCGKRQNASSASPCYRRHDQCLGSDIDRCIRNRDIRRTKQIANRFCPTFCLTSRPNYPDSVEIRQLKICPFCCHTIELNEMVHMFY